MLNGTRSRSLSNQGRAKLAPGDFFSELIVPNYAVRLFEVEGHAHQCAAPCARQKQKGQADLVR